MTTADAASTRIQTPQGPSLEEFLRLEDAALIARYRRGLDLLDRRLFELSDEQFDQAFLPEANVGRWPIRVLVGHLADAELAFVHRMRRAVAEQNPVFSTWDENAFIDSGLYAGGQHPVAGFVAAIHTLRRWTAEWLMTLMPEELARQGMHPERGPQSVRMILVYDTWHLEHHAAFLNAKVCRLLGPAPAEEAPAGKSGGCGAHCGCRPKQG